VFWTEIRGDRNKHPDKTLIRFKEKKQNPDFGSSKTMIRTKYYVELAQCIA